MIILSIVKVRSLFFNIWSYMSPQLYGMLNFRLANIFWVCISIFSKDMLVWCLFLDPYVTTHHSHIGVHFRQEGSLSLEVVRFCLPRNKMALALFLLFLFPYFFESKGQKLVSIELRTMRTHPLDIDPLHGERGARQRNKDNLSTMRVLEHLSTNWKQIQLQK